MIVGVRTYEGSIFIEYYDVPVSDKDFARKIAYKFVFKGSNPDYNTLVHNTTLVETKPIPQEMVDYLR